MHTEEAFRSQIWTRLPVANPTALQYYGNTQFAAEQGYLYNYPSFSQGFHPGLDLMGPGGTPIYAGVYAIVKLPFAAGYPPGRIELQFGDLVLLYGHVDDVQIDYGDFVTPGTIIGYIDELVGHVHIEIIYSDASRGMRMTNPLPCFSLDDQGQLLDVAYGMGDSSLVTFYQPYSEFGLWQHPYDQPDIIRYGEPIDFLSYLPGSE
jgi:murein DD-endopeptidase MepM/ murein hydrolase activator NlpD